MRSRFSAFALGDTRYLLETWHPSTRPRTLDLDDDRRWTQLEIIDTEAGSPFDTAGVVEFRAHYRTASSSGTQHERSRFTREGGRWSYVGGVIKQPDSGSA